MSALMVSMIKVKNQEKLAQYLKQVTQIARGYGAEIVFRGKGMGSVEGQQDHDLAVVVRFPSVGDIDAMYACDEYEPLEDLRGEAADMTILKYEQFPG